MATAAVSGRKASVKFGASTSALNQIGEASDFEVQIAHSDIDATSRDSSGWNESIAGQRSWTATAKAFYLRGDTAQKAIRNMLSTSGNTAKYWSFQPSTATGKWVGSGWITNYKVGGSHDKPFLFDVSFKGTGPVTYST